MASISGKKPRTTFPDIDHRTLRKGLESLYRTFNRRAFVHPDPLEFLYAYPAPADREIAGMIAASLAYGRVHQILKSVSWILEKMSPSPAAFLSQATPKSLVEVFQGFVHRFASGRHLSGLLNGLQTAVRTHGSLNRMFLKGFSAKDPTVQAALIPFARQLTDAASGRTGHLIPLPDRGSACKRLHLFLRWMVRKDTVDPGGWEGIPASKLIVPLDTHLHAVALSLGFTARKAADITTALEITERFRRLRPEDPVRYDFVLTRFGIRRDLNPGALFPS